MKDNIGSSHAGACITLTSHYFFYYIFYLLKSQIASTQLHY